MSALSLRFIRRIGITTTLTMLLVTGLAPTAPAQMFYLERPRLGSEFEYDFEQNDQTTPTSRREKTSHQFIEGLTLTTRGFAYHQNTLVFDLEFNPKWEQQEESLTPGGESSRRSFYLDYSFNGTMLQSRQLFLQLLARQGTMTSSSNLSPTSTHENTAYGATLVFKSRALPTRFSYLHNQQRQEGFYASTQNNESLRLSSRYRTARQETTLNGDYEDRQRKARSVTQNTENTSLRLNNSLQVTTDRRIRLNSGLTTRWTKSTGGKSRDLNLGGGLNWQHTPPAQRLQINSSYTARYTAIHNEDELRETIPLATEVTLTHQLYENLRTTLRANAGHTTTPEARETIYGGGLAFDYIRRIPAGMMLSLNLGHAYQVNDRISSNEAVASTDESVTLSDFNLTLLASRYVELTSVQVFSADGWEYHRDSDYTLTVVGNFVQIARNPFGGAISEGETVLVRYRFRNDPSAQRGTLTRTYGAGLARGSIFSLRYSLTLITEELLSGLPPDTLADDTRQNVSAQLNYGWSDTLLTADEERNTAGNSSRRWRLTQNFRWRPRPDLALNVNANYGETELLDNGQDGDAYGLRANAQWQSTPNQQWRFETFRDTKTTNQPTRLENTGLGLFYTWRYGIWRLQADYRFILEKQPLVGQEKTLNSLNLALRRTLY
ncbi:MAG: hypothetical protein K0A93_12840 [Desulfuromonadaceae bacterium]|nr:hypothetical protein [Desulfuromonadaceae bacterium]